MELSIQTLIELLENNSFTIKQDDEFISITDDITQDIAIISKQELKDKLITSENKLYKEFNNLPLGSKIIYHRGIRYCISKLKRAITLCPTIDTPVKIDYDTWLRNNYELRGSHYFDKKSKGHKGLTTAQVKAIYNYK